MERMEKRQERERVVRYMPRKEIGSTGCTERIRWERHQPKEESVKMTVFQLIRKRQRALHLANMHRIAQRKGDP